jgi:signal peptidase II
MLEALAGVVAVFVLDRGTKAAVFAGDGTARRVWAKRRPWPGLLEVRPVRTRAPWAWRRGSPAAWILAFAVALAAGFAAVQGGALGTPLARLGLGAALGGALGNLYDRLRHGAVLDFLHCGLRARGMRWTSTFNLADLGILGGLACLFASYVAALAHVSPGAG